MPFDRSYTSSISLTLNKGGKCCDEADNYSRGLCLHIPRLGYQNLFIGFDIFCVVLLSSATESTHSLDIIKVKERIAYGVPHSVIRGQDPPP